MPDRAGSRPQVNFLLAEVCSGVAILAVRSILWFLCGVVFYDCIWREKYRARLQRFEPPSLVPQINPERARTRQHVQLKNSPFGRAFARHLKPPGQPDKAGDPRRTRKAVDYLARIGLVLSTVLFFILMPVVIVALYNSRWSVVLAEVVVALVAIAAGWMAGLRVEHRGVYATAAAMLAGACVGGVGAGLSACTLWPPLSAAAFVTLPYKRLKSNE